MLTHLQLNLLKIFTTRYAIGASSICLYYLHKPIGVHKPDIPLQSNRSIWTVPDVCSNKTHFSASVTVVIISIIYIVTMVVNVC